MMQSTCAVFRARNDLAPDIRNRIHNLHFCTSDRATPALIRPFMSRLLSRQFLAATYDGDLFSATPARCRRDLTQNTEGKRSAKPATTRQDNKLTIWNWSLIQTFFRCSSEVRVFDHFFFRCNGVTWQQWNLLPHTSPTLSHPTPLPIHRFSCHVSRGGKSTTGHSSSNQFVRL